MRADQHTVVAEALGRRAHLGVVANVATLIARATRKRRHGEDGWFERLNAWGKQSQQYAPVECKMYSISPPLSCSTEPLNHALEASRLRKWVARRSPQSLLEGRRNRQHTRPRRHTDSVISPQVPKARRSETGSGNARETGETGIPRPSNQPKAARIAPGEFSDGRRVDTASPRNHQASSRISPKMQPFLPMRPLRFAVRDASREDGSLSTIEKRGKLRRLCDLSQRP